MLSLMLAISVMKTLLNFFYSDDFCNHAKEYKDWVCAVLKNTASKLVYLVLILL